MHKPIYLKDLCLSFPHKLCFSDFSEKILYGSRIAIIGQNGAGKSILLKIIQGIWSNFEGIVSLPQDLRLGYLPQVIFTAGGLSGGEHLNRALSEALYNSPNLLLLDEPTNHLDKTNRRALMNYLCHYKGTLIIVTHDVELLRNSIDIIWHIQGEKIQVFNGKYDEYLCHLEKKNSSIEKELTKLHQKKEEVHQAKMKEEQQNKNRRLRGEKSIQQRKWPTVRSLTKLGNTVKTGNQRLHLIQERKEQLLAEQAQIFRQKIIQPKFQLKTSLHPKSVITIKEASVGYKSRVILENIEFHMRTNERVALCGDNGSGKSTFIKGILADEQLTKKGSWILPDPATIGYLDQHYQNLPANKTVWEMVETFMPTATIQERRKHLNDFLFRKNEEVQTSIKNLSGGEKARLSLCWIAARSPSLLILDEMTNNLDLETRSHVIQVLKEYPGAMIVISHDEDFLKAINIETVYLIHQGKIQWIPFLEEIK